MTCNVGGTERSIRIVLGLVLIGVGAFSGLPDAGMYAAYIVGAVAMVTGAIGFCPAWFSFGVNTCPAKPADKP